MLENFIPCVNDSEKILFIFSSGFDSFSNTENRDTRGNNYLNYDHGYQDRGHYQEHNSYNSGPNSYSRPQQDRNSYDQNYYSHNTRGRDPYTEQTIQSYPPQDRFYTDQYNGYGEVVNNEILGECL